MVRTVGTIIAKLYDDISISLTGTKLRRGFPRLAKVLGLNNKIKHLRQNTDTHKDLKKYRYSIKINKLVGRYFYLNEIEDNE